MQDFAPIIDKIAKFLAPDGKAVYQALPQAGTEYSVRLERVDGTQGEIRFTLEKYAMTVSFAEYLAHKDHLDDFLADLEYQEEQSRMHDVKIRTSQESGRWILRIEA